MLVCTHCIVEKWSKKLVNIGCFWRGEMGMRGREEGRVTLENVFKLLRKTININIFFLIKAIVVFTVEKSENTDKAEDYKLFNLTIQQ